MLPCEQGVRVESRFSGSSLTPCSAIASRPRCHGRRRVRTRRRLSPVPAQPDPWWFLAAHSAMCALLFIFFVCFFLLSLSLSASIILHHGVILKSFLIYHKSMQALCKLSPTQGRQVHRGLIIFDVCHTLIYHYLPSRKPRLCYSPAKKQKQKEKEIVMFCVLLNIMITEAEH